MRDRFNERLERKVIEDRVTDPESGFEIVAKRIQEAVRSVDGLAIESKETRSCELLSCGHPKDVGTPVATCELCKQKGLPYYVCANCSVQCPITGILVCKRHSVLGRDNRYYSPSGYRQAKRSGLFSAAHSQGGGGNATGLLGAIVAFLRHW